jgi:hypothetical protein
MGEIRVTLKHIKDGRRRCPWGCPVALAIKEALGIEYLDAYRVYVDVHHITVDRRRFAMPPSVRKFVRRFDAWLVRTPKPFEFDLMS